MSIRRIDVREHGSLAWQCKAFLNGEQLVHRCFAADPIEGWADCYILDNNGLLAMDEYGEPKEERLYGEVRIEKVE